MHTLKKRSNLDKGYTNSDQFGLAFKEQFFFKETLKCKKLQYSQRDACRLAHLTIVHSNAKLLQKRISDVVKKQY